MLKMFPVMLIQWLEYLQTPCLPQEEDPLDFWKENRKKKIATLVKIAPKFLCIPASSAQVERLFSIAGKVFHPELYDKTFEELMFIMCNQHV